MRAGAQVLTPTEAAVVDDVLRGLPNDEIARQRGVTLRTVQRHVARACSKLDASAPDELARALAGRTPLSGGRVLYEGPGFVAGEFSLEPGAWQWGQENWIGDRHHVVFPRTAVVIRRRESIVADASAAVLYDRDETYRREVLDRRGDRCTFFALAPDLVRELAAAAGEGRTYRFPQPRVPVGARCYAAQLHCLRWMLRPSFHDRLGVDELVLTLLDAVLSRISPAPGGGASPAARDIVEEVRRVVSIRYAEPLGIADLAAAVHVSPYHLARTFKTVTGSTLHRYRTELRLREALHLLLESDDPIADVATRTGFAGHSHFTDRFRRSFGFSPARLRSRRVGTRDVFGLLARTEQRPDSLRQRRPRPGT